MSGCLLIDNLRGKLLDAFCIAIVSLWIFDLRADTLDEGVGEDVFLNTFAQALISADIDVTSNLNARDVVSQRIQRPRLGRFPDLPANTFVSSQELLDWEEALAAGEIGGLSLIPIDTGTTLSLDRYLDTWFASDERIFVTFVAEDQGAAEKIAEVAAGLGYEAQLHFPGTAIEQAGRFYATAAQRLAVDSRLARRYKTEITELDYLGERVRRRSNSLFKDDGNRGNGALARREPAVFLKESLGDEFNQSTISEIIVPGGVALGETARLDFQPRELVYENGRLVLTDEQAERWLLPEISKADMKSLFDFVQRSTDIDSDAIVDIDADGRVKVSSALRDTDVGYKIMHADTQPFEFVTNLPVTKSVIIDTAVAWERGAPSMPLQFESEIEVRYVSADNMRIAQTRVALEYTYDSQSENPEYTDSWGRDLRRLHDSLDYSGLGQSMTDIASYAGWIGLFRHLQEEEVPFLRGRYEFMKIENTGEKTPIRY